MADGSSTPQAQAVETPLPGADADVAMSDAPATETPTTSTPTHNRTSTPTGARTSTPSRNGGQIAGPPAQSQPAAPAKALPNGAKCRQYLNDKVTVVLLEGMKKVAAEQPDDPLKMLGEHLLAKSQELEGTS